MEKMMESLGQYRCVNCCMVFRSGGLLDKHKALFCIGSDIGDPVALRQRPEHLARDRERGLQPKQARTPDLVKLRGGQRQQQRKIRWSNTDVCQPESLALQTLTGEFHKLRMSIEETLPKPSKGNTDTEVGHGERMKEMKEMASLHERQLAEIQAHNQHLELQRDELARRLAALAGQNSTSHLETLMLELKEQEERNEETLQQLTEHINALQVKVVSVPADQPEPRMHPVMFDLIASVDGPLSNQIRALRLAYMQSGGSDPAVLAQMHDLQAEAQTMEQTTLGPGAKGRKKKVKPPQCGQSWELLAMEQENHRLEEEILRLQLARERHHGHEAAGTEIQLMQRENLLQVASVQAEIENLRREMERAAEGPRHRRQPPPPPPPLPFPMALLPHARLPSSPLGRHVMGSLDSLGPAPYDPTAGFVIFYDLVLGVDTTLSALRLVVALYMGEQEVGRPTPLPTVQCQPGRVLPYTHSLSHRNYAYLSAKQQVPRMQPSPSLSLVVEFQAAGGVDIYGQDLQRLVSLGWARLSLFDKYNQVHSGHWRAPVRCLPVKPSLSTSQLNCVPQVGIMELCIRLVNARDGDLQTLVKPDPNTTSHYMYPIMASSSLAPHSSTHQPFEENQIPSDHPCNEDSTPPPTEKPKHS